jgi:3-hydroxypropanoate dehydrogenase
MIKSAAYNEEITMKPVDTMPVKPRRIGDGDLRQLFLDARTHNGWLDKPVPDSVLGEIYEIAKFGPTSMNAQPMRLTFLRTAAAKERLRPYLGPANVDKTMGAPVTAIVAHILGSHEHLPKLFPHNSNAKSVFEASWR